jgi:SAM-dependent methyltransferase
MFDKDPLTAMEAVTAAQWLAFAPLAFQATAVMRDRGVLAALAKAGPQGCTLADVAQASGLPPYGVRVLMEAGLGLRIMWRQGERYVLGKLGRYLLDDGMTRANFDFTRDVCYQAAAHLDEAIMHGTPAGLRTLGPWDTVYEGISVLPEPARGSWHAFDHFYSDQAFPDACAKLAADLPARMLDIGCNTGKWAQLCLAKFPGLRMGLVDLQPQLDQARSRLQAAGLADRAQFHPVDLLDANASLPTGFDMVWMSQFLDCFPDEQIVAILAKVREALAPGGRVWILELFWDRQRFEAAAFSLQQISLYFTCVANGNSQMYDSPVFLALVERAGLEISSVTDGVGGYHTLLECRRAA